ncbi:hypothetical protein D9613_008437 [Agrocybe pediades]|uniref:Uncharacterized protein n=1 Tax=Agrocybe pediades TaxID=84607 RepID=A0A8H4QTA6_9AGAR|nr:hypothetical protein D9613_008437 [Agrocybe pediades]
MLMKIFWTIALVLFHSLVAARPIPSTTTTAAKSSPLNPVFERKPVPLNWRAKRALRESVESLVRRNTPGQKENVYLLRSLEESEFMDVHSREFQSLRKRWTGGHGAHMQVA